MDHLSHVDAVGKLCKNSPAEKFPLRPCLEVSANQEEDGGPGLRRATVVDWQAQEREGGGALQSLMSPLDVAVSFSKP